MWTLERGSEALGGGGGGGDLTFGSSIPRPAHSLLPDNGHHCDQSHPSPVPVPMSFPPG